MKSVKDLAVERRKKNRFPMTRDLRYKILEDDSIVESGTGTTIEMGSGGVRFQTDHHLPNGTFIELSISWPVLLEDSCPMRFIAFGRLLRSSGRVSACTIDKYEFRTQARAPLIVVPARTDSKLQRWAGNIRKETLKEGAGA